MLQRDGNFSHHHAINALEISGGLPLELPSQDEHMHHAPKKYLKIDFPCINSKFV